MSKRKRTTSPRRDAERQLPPPAHSRPLDALALEAIDNFRAVFERCGFSSRDIAERLMLPDENHHPISRSDTPNATAKSPNSAKVQNETSAAADSDIIARDVYSQLLSWWWTLPDYCVNGTPRAIPSLGSAPSLSDLVDRLGPQYTLEAALYYLLSTGSIREVDGLHVPLVRWVTHHDNEELRFWHHFRAVAGLLRTACENAMATDPDEVRFEFIADNLSIPVSKVPDVREEFRKSAEPFLVARDEALLRYARTRKGNERTVAMMIGVWVSEGGPREQPPNRKAIKKKRTRS